MNPRPLSHRQRPRKPMINRADVTVQPVENRQQWRAFHGFPKRIYATDPAWVQPLNQTISARWRRQRPWFEHAQVKAWLAMRAGEVVGTISAQVDDRALDPTTGRVGYFGQFEAIDDAAVARALVNEASAWLKRRDCDWVSGPFDLHINEMCGLLVDGFDTPPMIMMPHHPRYYAPLLKASGLHEEMALLAYRVNPDFEPPKVMARLQQREGARIELRSIDRSRYVEELELLRGLFNDAWQDNWRFVPFSSEEFAALGKELRPILNPQYTAIAFVDGAPAGFIIALPNLNEITRTFQGRLWPLNALKLMRALAGQGFTTARVPLMGVSQRFHKTPMGALVAFSMIDAIRHPLHHNGVRNVEMSWILETNEGMNGLIEAIGGERYKTYQMYGMGLE